MEIPPVLREVPEPEVFVRHGKHPRGEVFVVGLAFTGDVARAPAGVDQLPVPVVDFDGVPGVALGFGGDGVAGLEGAEAEAFPVAPYYD